MLQKKNMTTYDYIRWKEDRKKESKIKIRVNKELKDELKSNFDLLQQDKAADLENPIQPKKGKKSFREIMNMFFSGKVKSTVVQNPEEEDGKMSEPPTTPDLVSPPSEIEVEVIGNTNRNLISATKFEDDFSEEFKLRDSEIQEVDSEKKMLAVLRLGTGNDNQGHVTRPRTATQIKQAQDTLKRVDSKLHTITENAAEDHLV